MRAALAVLLLAAVGAAPASAQLTSSRSAPIASGHVHINTADIDGQKRFWQLLGGQVVRWKGQELIQFPDLLILFTHRKPSGGTRGSSLNHIGFEVPDVAGTVRKAKEAGYSIVTRTEVSKGQAKGDIFYSKAVDVYLAFLMGPEGVKVEIIGNPKLDKPIVAHHFHLAAPNVVDVRDWYVRTFGFTPNKRGAFEESVAPGVRVSMVEEAGIVGTEGRVIDHIGFEVTGLTGLCERLKTGPPAADPKTGAASAFLQDPVGTRIELTEGLKKVGSPRR